MTGIGDLFEQMVNSSPPMRERVVSISVAETSSCGRETVSSFLKQVARRRPISTMNLIAHRWAHGVVEHLEAIEIDEQDGVLALWVAPCVIEQVL